MTAAELNNLLESSSSISVDQLYKIVAELREDCERESCNDNLKDYLKNMYAAETHAFEICLQLISLVRDEYKEAFKILKNKLELDASKVCREFTITAHGYRDEYTPMYEPYAFVTKKITDAEFNLLDKLCTEVSNEK